MKFKRALEQGNHTRCICSNKMQDSPEWDAAPTHTRYLIPRVNDYHKEKSITQKKENI